MSKRKNSLLVAENDEKGYEEYERLLLERDRLIRDCYSYQTAYTIEFGDMIAANFDLKVECIKKKKTIAYCRRRLNRGLSIDTDLMQEEIGKEMAVYDMELREMLAENAKAKKAGSTNEYNLNKAKKLYRRLTKLLHPDINRKTSEDKELMELWNRIYRAYQNTAVDELEDLEVLVKRAMEDIGDGSFELNLDDIEARIERVENQINEILTTEPYTYLELLIDEEKKKARKEELQAEHDDYEEYLESLSKTLDEMLSGEGVKIVWQMS